MELCMSFGVGHPTSGIRRYHYWFPLGLVSGTVVPLDLVLNSVQGAR